MFSVAAAIGLWAAVLLMRLADAIAALGDRGMQVHRELATPGQYTVWCSDSIIPPLPR